MLVDTAGAWASTPPAARGASRLQQVAAALDNTNFLARLRKKHNVTVVTFNSVLENDRRVVLPLEAGSRSRGQGAGSREQGAPPGAGSGEREQGARLPSPGSRPPAWSKQLVPGGTETRLGEALKQLLQEERSTPVSGVVLISDGGLNAGESPDAARNSPASRTFPSIPSVSGRKRSPSTSAWPTSTSPSRVFPGDRFSVEGSIQGYGLKGQSVRVELWSREERGCHRSQESRTGPRR